MTHVNASIPHPSIHTVLCPLVALLGWTSARVWVEESIELARQMLEPPAEHRTNLLACAAMAGLLTLVFALAARDRRHADRDQLFRHRLDGRHEVLPPLGAGGRRTCAACPSLAGGQGRASHDLRGGRSAQQRAPHAPPHPGFNQYRRRNVIERCAGWLKQARAEATRFDKLAAHYPLPRLRQAGDDSPAPETDPVNHNLAT